MTLRIMLFVMKDYIYSTEVYEIVVLSLTINSNSDVEINNEIPIETVTFSNAWFTLFTARFT